MVELCANGGGLMEAGGPPPADWPSGRAAELAHQRPASVRLGSVAAPEGRH